MEYSVETAPYFFDDLLNFSSDIEEESGKFSSRNGPLHHSKTNAPEKDYSFPDLSVEEELEWLSNEDAFPKLESFDVALRNPKHQSPVSVLEGSVGSCGLHIPVRARSKRGRRNWYGLSEFLITWGEGSDGKKKRAVAGDMKRKCLHCLSEKTPQWRAGPLGPKTLCNACGVRFKAGRLVPEYRPANSPSFSSDLHSNSHRKILDMRRRKQKALENG